MDSIAQGCLDGGAGLQSAENLYRSNRCPRQIGRHVRCDDSQTEDLNVKHLARSPHCLKAFTAEPPQTKIHCPSRETLLDRLVMTVELIADGGPDEVGAVGVESLLHQEVDMAKIDVAEINRDLLGFA